MSIDNRTIIRTEPKTYSISRDRVPGEAGVRKFGAGVIPNGTYATITSEGVVYSGIIHTAKFIMISGGNAADHFSGVGIKRVKIFGLDSTFTLQEEEITLSGAAVIYSENEYIRVYRAYSVWAGASGTNIGDIHMYSSGSVIDMAHIEAGESQTRMAIYTIPSGMVGEITEWGAGVIADNNAQVKTAQFKLVTEEWDLNILNSGTWTSKGKRIRDIRGLKDNITHHTMALPIIVPAYTVVSVEGRSNQASTIGEAIFNIILKPA